jgi:myo-inositol-1(or 4)-monophosphatase
VRHGEDLERIAAALAAARRALAAFTPGEVEARTKHGDDPVTAADTLVDSILKRLLPRPGEGWLSEETRDDGARLACRRVWVVDPLDGTREFVQGLPEWSVSVALVEDGTPVAGGICNPATGETFLGAQGHGVTLNGVPVQVSSRPTLISGGAGVTGGTGGVGDVGGMGDTGMGDTCATVLASRTEVHRGQWDRWSAAPGGAPFRIVPLGSVAYKLARVAAGLADATWTLVPKHEWDVAAGVALVRAAGGRILSGAPEEERFNRPHPLLSRLIAAPPQLMPEITALLGC